MNYQQMGMAALIPGMQFMLDRMQQELDELRQVLAGIQKKNEQPGDDEPVADLEEFLYQRKSKSSKGYWYSMTPKQRSAEMKRRAKVSLEKKQAASAAGEEIDVNKLHPRDKRSPRHKKWLAMMTQTQRKHWDNLSAKDRQNRIDKMLASRAAKQQEYINGRVQ